MSALPLTDTGRKVEKKIGKQRKRTNKDLVKQLKDARKKNDQKVIRELEQLLNQ